MVCLGFEPGVAGWKTLTNPLSYGGTPRSSVVTPTFPRLGRSLSEPEHNNLKKTIKVIGVQLGTFLPSFQRNNYLPIYLPTYLPNYLPT